MRLTSIPRPVLVALGLAGPALTGCGDDGETGSDEATVAGCLLCPPETCGEGPGPGPGSGTDGATSTSGATSGEDDTLGPCLDPLPPASSSGTDTGTGTATSDSTGADSGTGTGTGGMTAIDRAEIQRRLIDAGTLAPDVVDRLRRRSRQ